MFRQAIPAWAILPIFFAVGIGACSPDRGVFIKQEEYGEKWPFSVSAIYLECPEPHTVIFHTGKGTYALNETARQKRRWKEVGEIWREDPKIPGAKISIDPLIERGLSLCRG